MLKSFNLGFVQRSGLRPTLFLVLAQDLNTLSGNNELSKFADDSTLLVPENSDVSVATEFSYIQDWANDNTYTHPFNGPLSGTTRVSQYQKGKTSLDFTEARDSEWQWHQLDHMQVCTSLQTDNNASTPPLSFLQAGCPSCRPTNSVKALKAMTIV